MLMMFRFYFFVSNGIANLRLDVLNEQLRSEDEQAGEATASDAVVAEGTDGTDPTSLAYHLGQFC